MASPIIIRYAARLDATPESELEALVACCSFLMERAEYRKAAERKRGGEERGVRASNSTMKYGTLQEPLLARACPRASAASSRHALVMGLLGPRTGRSRRSASQKSQKPA